MENDVRPLLDWLIRMHPDTPKIRAKQWIAAGRVSVDGVVIRKPHERIADPGDKLALGSRHATTLDCVSGWEIHPRVTLLHLDCALAVVNKGPGLISIDAPGAALTAQSILADYLVGKLKPRNRTVAAKSLPPSYRRLELLPVHRLDQYTSGVFCMAASPAARQHLIDQLKVHTMQREYVAYVDGRPTAPKGTWREWLELSSDEMRQKVLTPAQVKSAGPDAREAITHYELIDQFPIEGGARFVSKLRLRLETGRKHQIRVQAAHAGHPLIGDRTYNLEYRGSVTPRIDFDRQALHAESLNLEHPEKIGTRMTWKAELPKDLRRLENYLRTSA